MSRFFVIPGRESMNRQDDSCRSGTHVGVDQFASLMASARHQMPVAGEGLAALVESYRLQQIGLTLLTLGGLDLALVGCRPGTLGPVVDRLRIERASSLVSLKDQLCTTARTAQIKALAQHSENWQRPRTGFAGAAALPQDPFASPRPQLIAAS